MLQPTPFAAYAAYAPPNLDPPPESTRPRSGRQGFTPHSDNKSPAVGVVSFLMTLAANIMTFMALLPIVPFLRDAIAARRAGRSYDASNLALMPGFDTIAMVATGAFWLGVAGFVLGIVAAVTKRGRGWGFIAILVAIFGPIVVATAWAGMAVGR